MFNFLKPQIGAEAVAKLIVYDLAKMFSDGELSIEDLSRCDNVQDVGTSLGSDFN